MYIKCLTWLGLLLVLFIIPIMADNEMPVEAVQNQQSAVQNPASDGPEVPSITSEVLPSLSRIGIALAVIVAIIYLTVFLLRKLSGNGLGRAARGKTVQVVEHTYLAPKKSVCLLKMADRAILVGITEANINLLTECEWDELPEENRQMITKSSKGFQNALTEAAGKLFKNRAVKGGGNETTV
ncbi:MAG: flagellar biosynthetic protein FliO [candidate division Zixibacteria bacterium]